MLLCLWWQYVQPKLNLKLHRLLISYRFQFLYILYSRMMKSLTYFTHWYYEVVYVPFPRTTWRAGNIEECDFPWWFIQYNIPKAFNSLAENSKIPWVVSNLPCIAIRFASCRHVSGLGSNIANDTSVCTGYKCVNFYLENKSFQLLAWFHTHVLKCRAKGLYNTSIQQ